MKNFNNIKYLLQLSILMVFIIIHISAQAQLTICENDSIKISMSNTNTTTPFVTEYVLLINGALYGPNTTGVFDLVAEGISGPDIGIVYGVNHDGTENFSTWPTPISTCIESITQTVNITTCDTQSICSNETLDVSVSNANITSSYMIEYIMICGSNNYGPNLTGSFNIDSLGVNTPTLCTVYAVNHDGAETFDNWPTPVSNCIEWIELYVNISPTDSTFSNTTSCNPTDTGIIVQSLFNVNACDSIHTTTTTLLASDATFTNLTSCNPTDTGVIVQNLFNVNACDSIHTTTTTLITFDINAFASANEIEEGENVILSSLGDYASNYNWTNTEGSIISIDESFDINLLNTTTFYLTANYLNCSDSDSLTIIVNGFMNDIFIPNAFSPNLDNINDNFGVVNHSEFTSILLRVYNRWGELIFNEESANPRWDGTHKGDNQPIEIYIYYIETSRKGKSTKISGNFTLIR